MKRKNWAQQKLIMGISRDEIDDAFCDHWNFIPVVLNLFLLSARFLLKYCYQNLRKKNYKLKLMLRVKVYLPLLMMFVSDCKKY